MTEQRNLILAIVISVLIILGFQFFYEMPRMREAERRAASEQTATEQTLPAPSPSLAPQQPSAGAEPQLQAAAPTPRVRIDNGRLHGSVALRGARIDQVTLADFRETPDPRSPEIQLLSPIGSPNPYFAEFGWVGAAGTVVPSADTLWRAEGERIGDGTPVRLTWDNGQGLSFAQSIRLDPDFMFEVERTVTNTGTAPVTLYPYGLLSRWGTPVTMNNFILHEGPIGVFQETLNEIDYDDVVDEPNQEFASNGGWLGFTDKYWLAALIPQQGEPLKAAFRHQASGDRYQADFRGDPIVVQPGATVTTTDHLFAGAKVVTLLDRYGESLGLPLFDRAVDFGWFYFLTKPIFLALDWITRIVGNYGIAILALTLLIKLALFPLANLSYRSMAKMKKLQPEMMKLRERFADDKMAMNQELMALYKKEGANPMAGCLPIIVQIPIFFALYKVLFVTIEMRHAPFYGWINDLSAPDPTSIFNLFGLLPFTPPGFLMLGVWPLLMGLTMFLQTKLNPQPADPLQARIFTLMPLMFVFLFATFPAGLVIYWTWNNLLSIAQQWLIMRREGVSVDGGATKPA